MGRSNLLLVSLLLLVLVGVACAGDGDNPNRVLFTLNGEGVTEEQLRTAFRSVTSERADVLHIGCSAVNFEDDLGVIEFARALISGDIGDGIELESLDLDRLLDILRRECRGREE